MNKRKVILMSLIILNLLTACKSKQEREVDRFLSSKEVDMSLELVMSVQSVNMNVELCDIVATKDLTQISFKMFEMDLTTDRKNKKQYYSSEAYKIYTNYEEENEKEDEKIISDIYVEEDEVYFYISLDDMISNSLPNQEMPLETEKTKVIVDFKNDMVDSLYIDMLDAISGDEQTKEIFAQSGITKMGINIDVNNYGKVEAPNIEENEYNFVGEIEFSETLNSQLTESVFSLISGLGNNNNSNNPPAFNPNDYYLQLQTHDYVVNKGETLELKGVIRRPAGNFENIEQVDLYLNKDIDFNVPGKYNRKVMCTFNGYTYEQPISVLVVYSQTAMKKEFDFLSEINKIFSYDDTYVLISDNQYLYKYNVKTNISEGKVNLKCIAQDVYFKGEFLYVLAHYPYTTTYLEEDSYNSTITKIKLSDFSLVDQMTIDCLGYSFFVDKYDNIIISKGANQHIKYMLVNLEEKTKENIISGYQDDYFVYKEEKDAFLVITQGISSDNYYLSCKEGQYVYEKIDSSCSAGVIICTDKNDNLIIHQFLEHNEIKIGYDKYDEELGDYNSYQVKIGDKIFFGAAAFSTVYCNENKIYYYNKLGKIDAAQIIEYDLLTKTSKETIIEMKEDVSFIREIDSKLHLFLKDSNDAIVVSL